jgi:uncharacterized protein YndB with AHSA1/START domain
MPKKRDEKVDFKILVRVPPERVYDALATAAGLDSWFTTGATVDARPGGRIEFRWKDFGLTRYSGESVGPVLEADRPRRLVFQWKADSGGYDTTVEINIAAEERGTVLSLIETGYEDGPTGMVDLLNRVSGWAQVLTMMKFHLEHGVTY